MSKTETKTKNNSSWEIETKVIHKTKTKPSISKQIQQLDEMVEWFYGDDFELDQALAKYKETAALADQIEKSLANLKNQVEVIADFTKS